MTAVFLNAHAIVCALGRGADVTQALFAAERRGVASTDAYTPGRMLHLGSVDDPLPDLAHLPAELRSRCNALLAAIVPDLRAAVDDVVQRFGPARVGVVLGASTAGLAEGAAAIRVHAATGKWPADYRYAQQEMGNPARFVARAFGCEGLATTISTACSSSAKALASAARLVRSGMLDAVVAGGVDALSDFTIAGFASLESVSEGICNPMSARRCGINIGEGAALFVVSRETGPVRLAGWGESSDAHHMSAPEPTGRGARAAMLEAIARANVAAGAIDYVNLHGTATPQNDAMESRAVAEVLGTSVPVSSTKPLTGHALGAAGAIEAALCWGALIDNPRGLLPPHWWDGERDSALPPLRLALPGEALGRPLRHVLSNSFAFGGSNASLLLARE